MYTKIDGFVPAIPVFCRRNMGLAREGEAMFTGIIKLLSVTTLKQLQFGDRNLSLHDWVDTDIPKRFIVENNIKCKLFIYRGNLEAQLERS